MTRLSVAIVILFFYPFHRFASPSYISRSPAFKSRQITRIPLSAIELVFHRTGCHPDQNRLSKGSPLHWSSISENWSLYIKSGQNFSFSLSEELSGISPTGQIPTSAVLPSQTIYKGSWKPDKVSLLFRHQASSSQCLQANHRPSSDLSMIFNPTTTITIWLF
jgi:hypothetical protein